jgi:hypothetical protein
LPPGDRLLRHLAEARALRARSRVGALAQAQRVALRTWQSARLARTYPDLLASTRYRDAAQFFLEDLYGPKDFSARDDDLARIVPTLKKLLPEAALATIAQAVELDALSEQLDAALIAQLFGGVSENAHGMAVSNDASEDAHGMDVSKGSLDNAHGEAVSTKDAENAHGSAVTQQAKQTASETDLTLVLPSITDETYATAYRLAASSDLRARQIDIVQELGDSLNRLTKIPMLALTLKMMRGPATAAGLSSLHEFLARGFAAFKKMGDAKEFLATITGRERWLMERLFAGDAGALSRPPPD